MSTETERSTNQIVPEQKVLILDPSDKFRPEKNEETFRDFTTNSVHYNRVCNTYLQMHTNQSYEFAKEKLDTWTQFNHGEMTIMEVLHHLNNLVDESDPDTGLPNIVHAFQTAERIREKHPDKDWFHLAGLIHDAGKIMACFGEPQWCVVGDTFPVGCTFSNQCVFGEESFKHNPDVSNPLYSLKRYPINGHNDILWDHLEETYANCSKLGIYEENCGLNNVIMSWGHDEYLYRVLKNHPECALPEEAYQIIKFHSFYPWHTMSEYDHLCNNTDREMIKWIQEFNKFDLYSKADSLPDVERLESYYQGLIDKYIPGKLKW